MTDPGLLEWCNATRFSMANDPGRPAFEGQIQKQGLHFLNDYLDNILASPRQDPLIDLVKTPARKRVPMKKPVSSTTLKSVITVSLEDKDELGSKENIAPVNNFHRALLQTAEKPFASQSSTSHGSLVASPPHSKAMDHIDVVVDRDVLLQLASEDQVSGSSNALVPAVAERNDLSMIAEDDEAERSRSSFHTAPMEGVIAAEAVLLDASVGDCASADASDPLSRSPNHTNDKSIELEPVSESSPNAPRATADTKDDEPMVVVEDAAEPTVMSLPTPNQSSTTLPSVVEAEDSDDHVDGGLASLPSLPAPMIFRKSMRAPTEAANSNGLVSTATPGAALGKRKSSWLVRAREVKALEMTTKKPLDKPVTGSSSSIPPLVEPEASGSGGNKRKSADVFGPNIPAAGEEERQRKIAKKASTDLEPAHSPLAEAPTPQSTVPARTSPLEEEVGLLAQLKKTVGDIGRLGKSFGPTKSLGGAAATALAEARAAAEARLAERLDKEEANLNPEASPAPPESHSDRRLSVSELMTASETRAIDVVSHGRKTTTPPNSPPVAQAAPPVFNKPVFIPPAPVKPPSPYRVTSNPAFGKPASMALGLAPRLISPKQVAPSLSHQSTLESLQSDALFDSESETAAWMPATQDTEYTTGFGSQSQCSPPRGPPDEDDSWPLDSAGGVPWFNVHGKEDSMTWSTLPTSSQRGDTGPVTHSRLDETGHTNILQDEPEAEEMPESTENAGGDAEFGDDAMEVDFKQSTVHLVNPAASRSQSQLSMLSSSSQGGFFSTASKLANSMLGTSKKGKPEVKSLQLAAAAAKKQHEEQEKKALRLKEMENRRHAALQRKVEEERAKAQDEERKLKEESDRRKKERDDVSDKRVGAKGTAIPGPKKEEEAPKKAAKPEKKLEIKKPSAKTAALAASSSSKPTLKPLSKTPSSANLKAEASSSKLAVKVAPKAADDDITHPSQLLQSQMAARAKAQLQAANVIPTPIPSESIELPDINSEYSDSDDEDRPRSFDPPSWAQSPDLRQALELQSTINPDDIFGAIRPLKMDELFRNRTGRFRARTSSANWTGSDRLTIEEQREYVRRMGFRSDTDP
ncbi:unnamed protein product [Mycena citricolor]|uniref:Inner centromere protein ARK-binding domain-containing protein n=1 Tax=Mycena citricolor TaxID=2018698 RepID=A0AAD2HSV9_9AGAR|nr:unnamed protein product [Mycena citricolor]